MSIQAAEAALNDELLLHIFEGVVSTVPPLLQSHSHDFRRIVDHQLSLAGVFHGQMEHTLIALRLHQHPELKLWLSGPAPSSQVEPMQ